MKMLFIFFKKRPCSWKHRENNLQTWSHIKSQPHRLLHHSPTDEQCRGNKETNKYYRRPQFSFSKLKDIPAVFAIDFI